MKKTTLFVEVWVLQHLKTLMQLGKNFYLLPYSLLLTLGLLSCGKIPDSAMNSISLGVGVNVVNIRDLKPKQDQNATVYLQGKVIRQVPLVSWLMYQLQDSTGTIWVLTNKTNLRLADQVLLQGKVRYQSIPIGGKDFGEVYVEEQQQLERTPSG